MFRLTYSKHGKAKDKIISFSIFSPCDRSLRLLSDFASYKAGSDEIRSHALRIVTSTQFDSHNHYFELCLTHFSVDFGLLQFTHL